MSEGGALRDSAARVQRVLQAAGVALRVVEFPRSTRTALEAAEAVGCDVAQIAKSLVFRARHSDEALLVVASGASRVDEQRLAALAGEPVERPDAAFVRGRTGFAIGGVPPVGHQQALRTFIDEDLLALPRIWAAAGTPYAVFELTPDDLLRLTGGTVARTRP